MELQPVKKGIQSSKQIQKLGRYILHSWTSLGVLLSSNPLEAKQMEELRSFYTELPLLEVGHLGGHKVVK